ncbi:mannose-1-phosphate guanylyltransferase/mannose-6-phosphate isomerase [Microbaculum marinum]|uniref:mannose-1-phosphate guanylyltransferase n=1 Tax=Microbaculum marinum TaxID=1764581 RepID=A0AAW9RP95_9HYPH
MTEIVHAVMCGGSGTRLWPWSRRSYPKQFLSLVGDRSLLQATVGRLGARHGVTETIVIGNEEHRFLIAEQLRRGGDVAEIVLEPLMRNTAAVAIVAALRAEARKGPDCLVLLAPADHVIGDAEAYGAAIGQATPAAQAGYVVTFGITPDRPETGYGYIEFGDALAEAPGVSLARGFREKPDRETAEGFLASGGFAWNAGIFLFSPQTLIEAAGRLCPDMLAACRAACDGAKPDLDFLRLDAEPYAQIDDISFDYAFAEQLDGKVAVVPVSMGWSDVGSWHALYEARGGNGGGENVTEGPTMLFDTENTLAFSDGPLVVAHGLKDVVIVANHDAIYVASAEHTGEVKRVVAELESRNYRQAATHERVYRPWGWYQTLDLGERFQVKEIVVKPGGQLSLQSHHHRAEHWVVVRGTARVTLDDEVRIVTENESIFVPLKARHRLENPGRIPMHLIEVQTGSYLEEDDIVRYEDVYGRR